MTITRLYRVLAIWICFAMLAAGCQTPSTTPPATSPVEPVSPTSATLPETPTSLPEPAASPTLSLPTAEPPTALPQPPVTPILPTPTTEPPADTLFDDFSYANGAEMAVNGWILRSEPGWPGVPGATWSPEDITLIEDAEQSGNRLVQMKSSTDGTNAGTRQTQLCHQRKYLYGTYAARVRFSDVPVIGNADGDQIVETFYTISPLKAAMDPDYSENDFEYLPNGGWGSPPMTLFATTWETFSPEPNWKADNASDSLRGSQNGWHTLVSQVTENQVQYYIDGKAFAKHEQRFVPETPMSINFNLWFIRDSLLPPSAGMREYVEQIDWVFFQGGAPLAYEAVLAAVEEMRQADAAFIDTVPAQDPPLESPCNF